VANELGYKPNPLISIGLAQMRTRQDSRLKSVVAFVETGPYPGLANIYPAYKRMRNGIIQRAEKLGFSVETFWVGEYSTSPGRLESVLRARGIKGIIMLYVRDWKKPDEIPSTINCESFACITLGARMRDPDMDFASADHFGNTRLALTKLEEAGHRRIGLIIPRGLDQLLEGRISYAYEGWIREKEKRIHLPILFDTHEDTGVYLKMLVKWLKLHRPDAVYSLPQRNSPEELKLKLPRLPVWASMECDSNDQSAFGTDQLHEEVGSAAIDLLNDHLMHGRFGIPSVARGMLIEGHWHVGAKV
jgi:DNA-binding LacI/PurR family transcriptional regulator